MVAVAEPLTALARDRMLEGLDEHMERLSWSAEQIAQHQRGALRSLLAHALERSPFHARRLAGIEPESFEIEELHRLPIMTKSEMMGELDDVFTDRRLGRRILEDAMARPAAEVIEVLDEYLCIATGGSSGRRGVFVLDVAALAGFTASFIRPVLARTSDTENPVRQEPGAKMAMIAAPSPIHASGVLRSLVAGLTSFESVPATLPFAEVVARLNELQPGSLHGYPSMLALLASAQQDGSLRIDPRQISSMSETLLDEHRSVIAEAFGAPLYDTFGASEGIVGTTVADDPVFTFASDMCIIELVDADDRPVGIGEPSARVLITNLYNRVQPLIRYALDDSFTLQPPDPRRGHLRATVSGRADDVLRYPDAVVHPLAVRSVMVASRAVTDYQVRQTPSGVDVDVVVEAGMGFEPEALAEKLRASLERAGLGQPQVSVHAVEELERHPETGKFRRFVPLSRAG